MASPAPATAPGEAPGAGSSPCLAHGCSFCCYDTEMLLTNADVARLEGLGHKREDFMEVDGEGYATLRNVPHADGERKHCFFLKADRCSVYADRPEGCRWYPVIVNEQLRAIRDPECPHRQEFPLRPAAQRKLVALIQLVNRERSKRRK